MKNNRKLCPLRAATRAGQKAIATQMMRKRIPYVNQPLIASMPTSYVRSMHQR